MAKLKILKVTWHSFKIAAKNDHPRQGGSARKKVIKFKIVAEKFIGAVKGYEKKNSNNGSTLHRFGGNNNVWR